jgi:glycosyltransferase involved in cell wall biosynthesis
MRVLFASTFGHLPELFGGLQTTTDQLARALQRRGIEVALVCAAIGADAIAATSDYACGYLVVRAPDPVAALPAVVATFGPSTIVTQTGPELAGMLVAALDTELPTVVYLHNVEQGELGGVLLPDPKVLYLANSRFTAARWQAAFGVTSEVIAPYVEPALYVTETTRERILFVNPTVPKGVERFFQIAAARPALPFTVAESWVLNPVWRRFCQARAARLGNVEWLAPSADTRALYARTRLLLMPSLWEESYGRSVLEAQLSGIPVLASTRGNLVDTVGPGGLTVDIHAPLAAWLDALDHLWRDPDGGYAGAASRHARRLEVDPDYVAEAFLAALTRHAAARAA